MEHTKEESFYNRSLERALQIITTFNNDRKTQTLAQLSDLLGLPRATVLRLCSTLMKYDFLRQDPETKKYSLGLRVFELGSVVFNSFSLQQIASPFIGMLHRKVGKTIFFGILDNDEVLYIDKREDPQNMISFTSKVGTRRPPYWGMLGPLLMAYQSDDEIQRLLQKNPLAATARKSITNKEEFLKWLHRIRKDGYVIDIETAIEGIAGVAAPIRDFSGMVIASIGIAFIASSLAPKEIKHLVKEITSTATAISKEMGFVERNHS
ncbi:MAG TPA: IclR family transcriptional regulator [Syntrophorhabdaceae bacterium]|nr:IclR family transcriptional regulator [Syntrophorhabdaceae bacterium]